MAFAAGTIWEVQTGGSDSNGGGFDPSNANMATNLAATSATGNSPVVTSATYNFVAGDVGHWVFVKSGTNWTPGWYKIASVASNAATLSAAVGQAILAAGNTPYLANTAAGCATTASPTSGTWGLDYSQGATGPYSYTDMVIGATTTQFTSVANPVGPNLVGNVINVTSGTGFTVQRVQVTAFTLAGLIATCDKSLGTALSTGGNGTLGGCLLTPGQAGALHVGGNGICIKSGTYSITSATFNVAAGCLKLAQGISTAISYIQGYGSLRADNGTKPLLQASGISTFTLVDAGQTNALCRTDNISADGATLTASTGIGAGTRGWVLRCKAANSATIGFQGGVCVLCEATTCSGGGFSQGGQKLFCTAHDNTNHGFTITNSSCYIGCISANNTGGSTLGFRANGVQNSHCVGCVAYGNGSHGFDFFTSSTDQGIFINCYAEANGGYGFNNSTEADGGNTLINCGAFNNTSGATGPNVTENRKIGFITLTGTAFTNAAGNDFSLNNTSGGGMLLRAAGIPGIGTWALPGLSTSAYLDVGAVQHADPAGGSGIVKFAGDGGGFAA